MTGDAPYCACEVSAENVLVTAKETNEPDLKSQALPPVGEHVVVHCQGYSCLGYLDQDGIWKSVFTGKNLPDVIGFTLKQ
jgi:hypothetical protein